MSPLERRDRRRARKILATVTRKVDSDPVSLIAEALKEEREEAFFAAFHGFLAGGKPAKRGKQ